MSHESEQRAVRQRRRQRLRSQRARGEEPVSPLNNRWARIVQTEGNFHEARWQQEEGDKDARPPVLTAKSPAWGLDSEPEVVPGIVSQKVRYGRRPALPRHGENVEGEPA